MRDDKYTIVPKLMARESTFQVLALFAIILGLFALFALFFAGAAALCKHDHPELSWKACALPFLVGKERAE